jgi:hypothetical protein
VPSSSVARAADPAAPPEDSGRPEGALEWAVWTSWRGSPQLIRHLAEAALDAVQGATNSARDELEADIKAFVPVTRIASAQGDLRVGDEESFAPESFERITPEALRHFARIDILVTHPALQARIRFLRHGEATGLPTTAPHAPSLGPAVVLKVTSPVESMRPDVSHVARVLSVSLMRGHRAWWGNAVGSPALGREVLGRSLPRPAVLIAFLDVLVGALLAFGVVYTFNTLYPDARIPEAVQVALVALAGLLYPSVRRQLVPSIEIAEPGKTRFASALRWTRNAVVGLIVAQVATHSLGVDRTPKPTRTHRAQSHAVSAHSAEGLTTGVGHDGAAALGR